jgi:predicted amino acid dehydrogenase
VVIDDSQPPNITLETAREADATVLKCLARVPSLQCPFDYGLFPKAELAKKQTMVFTCLAETVMLAAEGYSDGFSVGSPSVGHIARIAMLAGKFGIGIAPFQGFPEIGAVSLG